MASQTAAVLDAIAAEIVAGTWAEVVTVERAWVHQEDQSATDTMQVSVAALSLAGSLETRGMKERDIQVIITLTKRLTDTTNDSVDPCIETIEQIRDSYGGSGPRKIVGALTAVAWTAEANPLYILAKLFEELVLWSEIIVTLRDYR